MPRVRCRRFGGECAKTFLQADTIDQASVEPRWHFERLLAAAATEIAPHGLSPSVETLGLEVAQGRLAHPPPVPSLEQPRKISTLLELERIVWAFAEEPHASAARLFECRRAVGPRCDD